MNSFFEALLLNNKERSSSWIVALAGGAALLLLAAGLYSHIAKAKYVLPPGPKGSPVIGNLRQVPAERSELQFTKWAKEYSEFLKNPFLGGDWCFVCSDKRNSVVFGGFADTCG